MPSGWRGLTACLAEDLGVERSVTSCQHISAPMQGQEARRSGVPGWAPCMPSSEPFLSSSELEEVVLEENWYFRFTVIGMLQLSRYL